MALNLKKNEKILLETWKSFKSGKDIGKWVLFGYEPRTFNLAHTGSGDGGLSELVEEFSDGLMQYGSVMVEDQNTRLQKIVLVAWQGMSVPEQVRGKCALHLDEVKKFLSGYHVDILARSEADIDEKVIMNKVKTCSGANYSVHNEKKKEEKEDIHVISSYSKINPKKEIDEASKLKFWKNEATSETPATTISPSEARSMEALKSRASNDNFNNAKKMEAKKQEQLDDLRRNRREEMINSLNKTTLNENDDDDSQTSARDSPGSKSRVEEAKNLASGNSKKLKSMFEKGPEEAPRTPVNSAAFSAKKTQDFSSRFPPQEQSHHNEFTSSVHGGTSVASSTYYPPDGKQDDGFEQERRITDEFQEPIDQGAQESWEPQQVVEETPEEALPVIQNRSKEELVEVVALFDYSAQEQTEISFSEGEIIIDVSRIDPDWWEGTNPRGERGQLPSNFVAVMGSAEAEEFLMARKNEQNSEPKVDQQPYENKVSARVLFDYEATATDELTITENEMIFITEQNNDGWWTAENSSGNRGLVPSNFIEII